MKKHFNENWDGIVRKGNLSEGVAEIILKQLGGNKFLAMTGAKDLMKSDYANPKWFSFKLPKAYNGVNYVKITLTSLDLYDMEFGLIRSGQYKVKTSRQNIYNDQLQKVFTSITGLDTHL